MFGNTVETRIFRKADDNVLAILSTAVSQTARMPGASVAGGVDAGPGSTIPATTTNAKDGTPAATALEGTRILFSDRFPPAAIEVASSRCSQPT